MIMHRILFARNIYQSSLHNISVSPHNTVLSTAYPDIKCSFCRKIILSRQNSENYYIARHQSTKTASALQKSSKRKAKFKNYKKFGELMEVGDKEMKEKKVSICKLPADHLFKLALTDPSNILMQPPTEPANPVVLEDDRCALIFTSQQVSHIEDKLKTKQYLDMVKESYYNFKRATLYNQNLKDLRFAINEGLNQEFDLSVPLNNELNTKDVSEKQLPKGAHKIFKEIFFENENPLDTYDHELISQISNLETRGLAHPSLDDICDESMNNELADMTEDIELLSPAVVKSLKIKKAKEERAKKKANREKRRVKQEQHMKQDLKDLLAQGKQETLHMLLAAHLQLLCALDKIQAGHQVIQYYRMRSKKSPDHPKITDVRIYNTMLHGYAATGQYKDIEELLSYMNEDCIDLNPQSFAAIFECIDRSNCKHKVELLNSYLERMKADNISLNDLLDKTKFLKDQREVVLKAIWRLDPQFLPVYTPPVLDYVCPLLDKLKLDGEERHGLMTSPAESMISVEEMKARGRKQLEIELKGDIEVKNITADESSETVKFYRGKLKETEDEWRKVIRQAFIKNLGTLKSQSNATIAAMKLYPYLTVLSVDEFVDLIMGEITKLVEGSETYSPTLKMLQRDLGSQIYQRYQIEQYRNNGVLAKISRLYEEYCEWFVARRSITDDEGRPLNSRQVWQTLVHRNRDGADLDIPEAAWPLEIRQSVGKFLYNIIINDIKIDVNMFKPKTKPKILPALYKVHRPWGRLIRLELKPHPTVARLWSEAAVSALRMRASLVPLACAAAPWHDAQHGAYLLPHTKLIRMPFNVQTQWKRLEEAPRSTLYPVLDSLNQLSEVPWVINKPLLDLQIQVFKSGGDKKLDIPQPPASLDTSLFESGDSKASAFRRRVAINRAKSEMYSLWCDALYKLSLANHYRDEMFWLPHNMDFRGRVYACPPHLSQLGADTARALLLFASPRPLGARGLQWLKLHAVNLTGLVKKQTIDERLQYADSVMELILDSADRPLDGKRWWTQSDEPWQTLACCKEIANAVRSPNHEEYMCRFPVHQDGSCNGLQHYAALGGDAAGAAAVNLASLPRPQDVYSAVAGKVEETRMRDAARGVAAAVALEGFVRRKVIKQTVMTTVYGVTRFGARLQIAKQLKDIDEFPKEHVWSCSQYLTARTFDSLQEMFTSTKQIQDWFVDCAKVISGVCGESVEWVTPLGLPVVQPYYRHVAPSSAKNKGPLDHHQRPCSMKQRNAFPPNFIHSLDSSHMMLTGLHCQARGITFISVHDCFWTHPDCVDVMNKICREQFVALHSQPILDELSAFMVKRYSYDDSEDLGINKKRVNNILSKVPRKGDFQLENVLKSVYFFS